MGSSLTVGHATVLRFADRDAVGPVALAGQRIPQAVEDVGGDVFGRGVLLLKGRKFVEILVIQFLHDHVHRLFQVLEIDAHAQFVKFGGAHRHLHLPIVAVRSFAVAGIVAQMVARGKMGAGEDIVHGKTSSVGEKFVCKSLRAGYNVHLKNGCFLTM